MRNVKLLIHSIGAIIVLLSFAWLIYANAVPSGVIEYVQDFEHRKPFLSDFWPPERIDPLMRSVDGAVRPVVEAPVSFFLHPPRKFATGTISLVYKLKEPAVFELALKKEPYSVKASKDGEGEFEVKPWDSLESLAGEWWRGTVTVAMKDWFRDENNRYYVQLRAPELWENKNVLFVREVRVKLEGRPPGLREWIQAFK